MFDRFGFGTAAVAVLAALAIMLSFSIGIDTSSGVLLAEGPEITPEPVVQTVQAVVPSGGDAAIPVPIYVEPPTTNNTSSIYTLAMTAIATVLAFGIVYVSNRGISSAERGTPEESIRYFGMLLAQGGITGMRTIATMTPGESDDRAWEDLEKRFKELQRRMDGEVPPVGPNPPLPPTNSPPRTGKGDENTEPPFSGGPISG